VIRNAGGRARDDALRALASSQQQPGTREVVVIHDTGCGVQTFTNDGLRARPRTAPGADAAGAAGIAFLPCGDLEASVRPDAAAIRAPPLVPRDVAVSGLVYDVRTGRLHEAR
jgi:carbonic anhydrase